MTRTDEALVAGLHSAARHYCMVARPTLTPSGEAALDLARRSLGSLARNAFLREIEHTTPEDFTDITDLHRFLHRVGETRRYVDPRRLIEPGVRETVSAVWAEERQRFLAYAGEWLIDAVKIGWPNWQERLYTGWDYQRPQ